MSEVPGTVRALSADEGLDTESDRSTRFGGSGRYSGPFWPHAVSVGAAVIITRMQMVEARIMVVILT